MKSETNFTVLSEPLVAICVLMCAQNKPETAESSVGQAYLPWKEIDSRKRKWSHDVKNTALKNDPSCQDVILNAVHWHLNIPKKNFLISHVFLKCIAAGEQCLIHNGPSNNSTLWVLCMLHTSKMSLQCWRLVKYGRWMFVPCRTPSASAEWHEKCLMFFFFGIRWCHGARKIARCCPQFRSWWFGYPWCFERRLLFSINLPWASGCIIYMCFRFSEILCNPSIFENIIIIIIIIFILTMIHVW